MKSLYVAIMRRLGGLIHRSGLATTLADRASGSAWTTWFLSLFAIYGVERLARLDVPWWTFASADLVDAHLAGRPGARVFEWGSGASTLWLARRASSVQSIEHDAAWANQLRSSLPANAEVRLVPPVPSVRPVVGSRKKGHDDLDFSEYARAIDDIGGSFDLIVIDGRAREACLPRALDHLADGGLIVFDNVDRARYRRAIEQFGHRLTVTTTRGLTPALPYPTRTALIQVAP